MPKLTFDIARRYLVGKKSTNLINIITGISIFGISIGTAALILILSVFNGLENLLTSLFNPYNPDLKITPIEGKFFSLSDSDLKKISQIEGIQFFSQTIEEVALFEYKGSQEIGTLKGVDVNFNSVTRIDTSLRFGKFATREDNINYGVIEAGIRNKLALNIDNNLTPIVAYSPLRKKSSAFSKEFKSKKIYPVGIFSEISDDGNQYVITNIELAQSLIQVKDQISALEIKLFSQENEKEVRSQLTSFLDSNLEIKNRYEQDELTLKMVSIEKWIAFLIAGLTILLIAFNLIGALWMIVLDKRKDIGIFKSFGFTKSKIRRLFISLGLLITIIGIIIGFILSTALYLIQKIYGLVPVPDSFLIDAYPVQLRFIDFFISALCVLFIGFMASVLPALKASRLKTTLKA